MNCPFCGREMQLGRMTAGGYPIRWVPEGKSTFFSAFSRQTVTISEKSLSSKGIPAYLCPACHKIIADF